MTIYRWQSQATQNCGCHWAKISISPATWGSQFFLGLTYEPLLVHLGQVNFLPQSVDILRQHRCQRHRLADSWEAEPEALSGLKATEIC